MYTYVQEAFVCMDGHVFVASLQRSIYGNRKPNKMPKSLREDGDVAHASPIEEVINGMPYSSAA